MFSLANRPDLQDYLDQFPVPMFAVERSRPDDDFRFLCLNDALEQSGDSLSTDVAGKTLFEILPEDEARCANDRYNQCAQTKQLTRFRDCFSTAGRKVLWDTTLQFVPMEGGHERVLGTTIEIVPRGRAVEPALEDIQYFSAMADLQLQNLISLFDQYRDDGLFSSQNEQRVTNISSMCRTVQAAVTDIKRLVKNTKQNDAPVIPRSGASKLRGCAMDPAGSDTLKALFDNLGGAQDGFRQ